jgi:hypothetical protein
MMNYVAQFFHGASVRYAGKLDSHTTMHYAPANYRVRLEMREQRKAFRQEGRDPPGFNFIFALAHP